jgi:hypothetical protein
MRGFFFSGLIAGYNHFVDSRSRCLMETAPAPAAVFDNAVSLLEKTPVLFETLLGDLPAGLGEWKPGPDRWSISEVFAHLLDIEQVYSDRVRRIAAEESPAFQRYDLAGASASGAYSRGTASEHLARFIAMRNDTVAVLKKLPASGGRRTGVHSELGTITLSEMLCEFASHDLGHLRQIAEIYRAHAFHPYAGPFQKYSNPKP